MRYLILGPTSCRKTHPRQMAGGDMLIWRWSWLGLNMLCVLTLTLHSYWHLWNDENTCGLNKSRPLRRECEVLWCFSYYFFLYNPDRVMCLCWQVGSLENLYTLSDSRGRPDRATFERNLAAAEGVSIFKCWIKCPSHVRIWRVDQAAASPKRKKKYCFSCGICVTQQEMDL